MVHHAVDVLRGSHPHHLGRAHGPGEDTWVTRPRYYDGDSGQTETRPVSESGYRKCDHRLLMSSSSSVSVSRKMAESSEGGSICPAK